MSKKMEKPESEDHVCRSSSCPINHVLRLGPGEGSRAVQGLVDRVWSYLSFACTTRDIDVLCRVKLSPATVQQYAKQIGNRIGEEWEELARKCELNHANASGSSPKTPL